MSNQASASRTSSYRADESGHAPGHLRDAFEHFIQFDEAIVDDREVSVEWLLGQLCNCSDTLPGTYCDELELPRGSTYAEGVTVIREQRSGE